MMPQIHQVPGYPFIPGWTLITNLTGRVQATADCRNVKSERDSQSDQQARLINK